MGTNFYHEKSLSLAPTPKINNVTDRFSYTYIKFWCVDVLPDHKIVFSFTLKFFFIYPLPFLYGWNISSQYYQVLFLSCTIICISATINNLQILMIISILLLSLRRYIWNSNKNWINKLFYCLIFILHLAAIITCHEWNAKHTRLRIFQGQ